MSEPVVFESLSDRVNKFNERVNKHIESQTLNPFSGSFKPGSRSPSPRPSFSKDEYGKPIAGSMTEQRGRKAHTHICREILELCEIIYDMGQYQAKYREKDDDEDEPQQEEDSPVIVRFGDLFQMYTKISDKCVGLLIAAKKRKLIYFEGEILFQRRDDDVLIALMKPIEEIRAILQQEAPDLIPRNVPENEQQQQQTNS
ncbi:actin-binding Rho-activating protein-like [Planococcus citri]|uniref:actin-binding Rho-activating protein-like n=1 Tax=Planococcus citri TaxID=170843 RepID=UPI0031F91741